MIAMETCRVWRSGFRLVAAAIGLIGTLAWPALALAAAPTLATAAPEMTMATFLDRLMLAESAGRDDARNPRSTAVGPFQFIETTFVSVAARHFAAETVALTVPQLLALRTNRAFARRAAEAFTNDNAAYLVANGVAATYPHLRLAFLVGPGGAARLLRLPPAAPVGPVLGAGVIRANPFLARMSVADLVARCARDLAVRPESVAGVVPKAGTVQLVGVLAPAKPAVVARCNLDLPSCRRWLALAERRIERPKTVRQARAGK